MIKRLFTNQANNQARISDLITDVAEKKEANSKEGCEMNYLLNLSASSITEKNSFTEATSEESASLRLPSKATLPFSR